MRPSAGPRAARARISLWGARAAYIGPALALAPHRSAAATVAIALDDPFDLALPADAAPATRRAALIPPGAKHHLIARGPMAFVYLDALSDDLPRLAAADLTATVEAARAASDVRELCAALGVPARPPPDPAIALAIRALAANPRGVRCAADLAAVAGLSPSRFQARFSAAVGVPFRRYRIWRRLAVVLTAMSEGRSLTDAAFEAGFASSAHLSAASRALFGVAPSALRGARIDVLDGPG